jgi:hypothetical protein
MMFIIGTAYTISLYGKVAIVLALSTAEEAPRAHTPTLFPNIESLKVGARQKTAALLPFPQPRLYATL